MTEFDFSGNQEEILAQQRADAAKIPTDADLTKWISEALDSKITLIEALNSVANDNDYGKFENALATEVASMQMSALREHAMGNLFEGPDEVTRQAAEDEYLRSATPEKAKHYEKVKKLMFYARSYYESSDKYTGFLMDLGRLGIVRLYFKIMGYTANLSDLGFDRGAYDAAVSDYAAYLKMRESMKDFGSLGLEKGMLSYNHLSQSEKEEKAREILQIFIIGRFPHMMELIAFDGLEPICNEFRAIDNYAGEFPVLKEELDDNGKPMMESLKAAEQTYKLVGKRIAEFEPLMAELVSCDERILRIVTAMIADTEEEVGRYADKSNTKEPYVYFHYSDAIKSVGISSLLTRDPMEHGTEYYRIIEKIQKDVGSNLMVDQIRMARIDYAKYK